MFRREPERAGILYIKEVLQCQRDSPEGKVVTPGVAIGRGLVSTFSHQDTQYLFSFKLRQGCATPSGRRKGVPPLDQMSSGCGRLALDWVLLSNGSPGRRSAFGSTSQNPSRRDLDGRDAHRLMWWSITSHTNYRYDPGLARHLRDWIFLRPVIQT